MWSRCTITSRAQISMSTDCPCAPPWGWWMRMREWGRVKRLPGAPAASSTAAAEAAWPDARGLDVGVDVLHGVVDREQRVHVAAGQLM